jgi:aminocarboxymuconate-semialdehyde decarboxylase
MTIDIHVHVISSEFIRSCEKIADRIGIKLEKSPQGDLFFTDGERRFGPMPPEIYDVERRWPTLERLGIKKQVLSPPPVLLMYDAPAEEAGQLMRLQNDTLKDLIDQYPDRFQGLATVPLQDVSMAVKELERASIDLKLSGVEIATNVKNEPIDLPKYRPFFKACQELGLFVLVHPKNVPGADRLRDYYMINTIGNPLDTTVAATRFVFSGILDELPDLKMCFSHAGGFFPFGMGRIDYGVKVRPECPELPGGLPSDYMRRFYYDTITFSSLQLECLIRAVGASQVLLGSDYPQDMGDPDPVKTLEGVKGITEEEKAQIRSGNAQRILR